MGRSLNNAIVAFLAPLPAIFFHFHFIANCNASTNGSRHSFWTWCVEHPLLLANAIFFLNVDVLFWIIGHVQSSNWMIDLYWTVIPLLLIHYHATFPFAQYNWWRSVIVMGMTWMWSFRLTHNYFRRENWQWGAREDWRFANMRRQYGKQWWWISFFSVYLSQQVFLMGICLPLYIVHSVDKPLNAWDGVAVAVCMFGIVVAYFADTQLHEYVSRNQELKKDGKTCVPVLERGLWFYSRHPNYFGEQLFWWGLAIFSCSLGHAWTFIGAFVNTLCLAYVTVLVERRMLNDASRAEQYRLYQRTTSVWIPWIKSSPAQS